MPAVRNSKRHINLRKRKALALMVLHVWYCQERLLRIAILVKSLCRVEDIPAIVEQLLPNNDYLRWTHIIYLSSHGTERHIRPMTNDPNEFPRFN